MISRRPWFPICVLLLPLLWMFRRVLLLGEQFAFRDASHYYQPFYQHIAQRWRSGMPLWNSLDNLGQPLLADPTAAVVYPLKLLYALPLTSEQCFGLYVVVHLWLAGMGVYVYARQLGATKQGALVGALSYELSGQVLFQYCNPIFCVGAAWLPWAMICFERLGRTAHQNLLVDRQTTNSLVLLAVCLSMMVYGGDPQMAYHFVLICFVRIIFFNGSWRTRNYEGADGTLDRRSRGSRLVRLVIGCVLALLLSSLQVLPSLEWATLSDRANDLHAGGHASRVYDFSVGPWRWIELFWPNISGPLFPENGRWLGLLPAEKRMWVPSLYMGLPSVLLAIASWRAAGKASVRSAVGYFPVRRWLITLTLLSMVAAMGEYGLGWLFNEVRYVVANGDYVPGSLASESGGLYWLFVKVLPGYASFRYPAKWWTIATFTLAVSAAKGWPLVRRYLSRGVREQEPATRVPAWLLGTTLVAGVFGCMCLTSNFGDDTNSIFGPFRHEIAWKAIGQSVLHVTLLLVAAFALWSMRDSAKSKTLLRWSWVIVLVDLCVAQHGLVQTVGKSLVRQTNMNLSQSDDFRKTTLYRSAPETAYPATWRNNSDKNRLAELKQCEIATLMPKHHLTLGTRSLFSNVSMASADYMAAWNALENDETGKPSLDFLALLGAKTILAPADSYTGLEPAALSADVDTELSAWKHPDPFARAWLVRDWRNISHPNADLQEQTELVFGSHSLTDFRRFAFVEVSEPLAVPESENSPIAGSDANNTELDVEPDACRIVSSNHEHVLIEATTTRRSLLVLADQFYPGWEARRILPQGVEERLPIIRTNRIMRGVHLEPGVHLVEFRYRPKSVLIGGIATALTLVFVGLGTLVRWTHFNNRLP